uniref:Uncharacterized protein n=1 Tax=Ananas comosus var. bracteatus TaxID=296719 RepID=A0A6V7PK21_ANACO|nr:unnamed protein product [Ananas comosus var. bracteatus]
MSNRYMSTHLIMDTNKFCYFTVSCLFFYLRNDSTPPSTKLGLMILMKAKLLSASGQANSVKSWMLLICETSRGSVVLINEGRCLRQMLFFPGIQSMQVSRESNLKLSWYGDDTYVMLQENLLLGHLILLSQ